MKKVTLFFIFIFFISLGINAQNDSTKTDSIRKEYKASEIHKMPEFKGGHDELTRYLSTSIRYPTAAMRDNVEGRVIVTFVVSETGKISNVSVQKSLSYECDAEAVRVVKKMPKWTPGMIDGKPVAVQWTLPVVFKLSRESNIDF